jgi:hypothetical protein
VARAAAPVGGQLAAAPAQLAKLRVESGKDIVEPGDLLAELGHAPLAGALPGGRPDVRGLVFGQLPVIASRRQVPSAATAALAPGGSVWP